MFDKHLVVVISGHGYGHAAMTAPLINALLHDHPEMRITVRSNVSETFLRSKFAPEIQIVKESLDFGMQMNSAFSVDLAASLQAYQTAHQNWPQTIEIEMARLKELKADLLISNIAYLPLIAAQRLEIPNIAFGCLNWADIFEYYFADIPNAQNIHRQITEAYQACDLFIRPEPSMPMNNFSSRKVGVCTIAGQNQTKKICQALEIDETCKRVLASMGGIQTTMNLDDWPSLQGVHYLIPDGSPPNRPDMSAISTQDFKFSDILASVDLFLTKPGYGAFSEAAINQTPILYVNRQDWPEHPYLCSWLQHQIPCIEISQNQFQKGHFGTQINELLLRPRQTTSPNDGIKDSLRLIEELLVSTNN